MFVEICVECTAMSYTIFLVDDPCGSISGLKRSCKKFLGTFASNLNVLDRLLCSERVSEPSEKLSVKSSVIFPLILHWSYTARDGLCFASSYMKIEPKG